MHVWKIKLCPFYIVKSRILAVCDQNNSRANMIVTKQKEEGQSSVNWKPLLGSVFPNRCLFKGLLNAQHLFWGQGGVIGGSVGVGLAEVY